MIYFLTNTIFFGSKVAEIVEADSKGFFLIGKDLPEGASLKKFLPKPFLEMCPLIFSVSDSGKTMVYDKGWVQAHNGMFTLLELYFPSLAAPVPRRQIDSLSTLSVVCTEEGINLKRCLSRNLRALVLSDPKNKHLTTSNNFLADWVAVSPAYSALVKGLKGSTAYLMEDSRFPTGYREPLDIHEGKGKFGERCNVTACQTPGQAFFWNLGTSAYYCLHCAVDIRKSNLVDADLFPELNGVYTNTKSFPMSKLKAPGTDRGEIEWK